MSLSLKAVTRVLAVAAVVAMLSAMVGNQNASTRVTGDEQCTNGRAPCPNVACVSACWADGTVPNQGTKVKNTPFAPNECEPGGGCFTQACH